MTFAPKMQPPSREPVDLFHRDPHTGGESYESQLNYDAKALLDAAKNSPATIPSDVIERGAQAMATQMNPDVSSSVPSDHTNRVGDRVFELCQSAGLQPSACQDVVSAYDNATLARASELMLGTK